jgi:hypothetical protein
MSLGPIQRTALVAEPSSRTSPPVTRTSKHDEYLSADLVVVAS